MAEATTEPTETENPKRSMGLLLSILLFVLGGVAGFFAIQKFDLLSASKNSPAAKENVKFESESITFVPLDPIILSLSKGSKVHHLRVRAELEVPKAYEQEVTKLKPRIVDIFHGYLRALDIDDVQQPAALTRIRIHLLRRAQLVVGEEKASGILISEFVLN